MYIIHISRVLLQYSKVVPGYIFVQVPASGRNVKVLGTLDQKVRSCRFKAGCCFPWYYVGKAALCKGGERGERGKGVICPGKRR